MVQYRKNYKKQPYKSDIFKFFIYADTIIVFIKCALM